MQSKRPEVLYLVYAAQ